MKRTSGKLLTTGKLTVLLNFLLVVIWFSQSTAQQAYEAYYLKIKSYPEDATHDWNPSGTESQGVTHDDANWYFTNTDFDGGNARLWRIPVSVALNQNVSSRPGVRVASMVGTPSLNSAKYNHWGDPDHYRYNGTDYILVPMTSGVRLPPAIAVFRAADLSFVAYNPFPSGGDLPDIGWCAVTPAGDLITSKDDAKVLLRYSVAWNLLQSSPPQLFMTYKDTHPLRDANGAPLNDVTLIHNMQGGEFTPSGELLYISSGNGECLGFGHGRFATDGIHVFETATWREIQRSANSARGERGYFNYSFDNGCTCLFGSQTPEGLTIWDLDDGRAPNVSGQLHVLMNFYNRYASCDDALSIQHFGGKLYVDGANGFPPAWADPLPGTAARPFNTVNNAFNWYPAWDRVQIIIRADSYPETGTFSKRVRITSQGGAAIVGKK